MANLGTIRLRVLRYLQDSNARSIDNQDVIYEINKACDLYKQQRFWFNEVVDTVTLTPSSAVLPTPSNYLVPSNKNGGFVIQDNNRSYPLNRIDANTYYKSILSTEESRPNSYVKIGADYLLYPTPDIAYELTRLYLVNFADLVNDVDSNVFTENAENLITLTALSRLSVFLQQSPNQATAYNEAAQVELERLEMQTGKVNAPPTITVHSKLLNRSFI